MAGTLAVDRWKEDLIRPPLEHGLAKVVTGPWLLGLTSALANRLVKLWVLRFSLKIAFQESPCGMLDRRESG